MTKLRVWLSHDGYRDPDDNLAQLVGAAHAHTVAKSSPNVAVAGLIFGDTTDGGQFHMMSPSAPTPARFGTDPRFDETAKNKVAAGNYAFFREYSMPALRELAPGWKIIDSVQNEQQRSWNYDPATRAQMSRASVALLDDIQRAIAKGGGPNKEVVVYSAGGGAHVPAEAIAFLLGHGYTAAKIKAHFAIVQHGRTNFALNLEPEARDITRTYTIAISKQDLDVYANGMSGPGLGKLARNGVFLEGDKFGPAYAKALDVAQGLAPFENLPAGRTFRKTTDGSDAGSHAFAVDHDAILGAWNTRLRPGDFLPSAVGAEHLIRNGGDARLRIIYDEFDWRDARALMNGPATSRVAAEAAGVEAAPVVADDPDSFDFRLEGVRATQRVEIDEPAKRLSFRLDGLDPGEAALVTAFDEDGAAIGTRLLKQDGLKALKFGEPVHHLEIEAMWLGGGRAPADLGFSVVWHDLG